jgi:hypothetical protein
MSPSWFSPACGEELRQMSSHTLTPAGRRATTNGVGFCD